MFRISARVPLRAASALPEQPGGLPLPVEPPPPGGVLFCTVLYCIVLYCTVHCTLYCLPPPGGRPLLGRAGAAAGHGQGSVQVSGCILSTLWVILPIFYRIIGNCVDNSHIRPQCHIQFIQYYSNLQTNRTELESDM